MLDFFQVLEAVLITPAGNPLDDASFKEVKLVSVDVFHRLDSFVFVVTACHLYV